MSLASILNVIGSRAALKSSSRYLVTRWFRPCVVRQMPLANLAEVSNSQPLLATKHQRRTNVSCR